MNEEQKLEEYLLTLKGLKQWKPKKDFWEDLPSVIQEKEQKARTRWMTAASFMAIIFSGFILLAGIKRKQVIAQIQIEQISEIYMVNNLNY